MRILALIVILGVLQQGSCSEYPDFYHTTASLNDDLHSIVSRCSNFMSLTDASSEPLIKELNINEGAGKRMRAYLLFGEHPRELISPESGINFVQDLCFNQDSQNVQKILDNYEIRMILNANPLSRKRVESGEFCLRENENGVDLNRNYDAHWEQIQDDFRQISSGPKPFSEPETQTIRNSLKAFNADVFLSVHSGTLGMYTPHAYSEADGEVNENNMLDVLMRLQDKYCPACDVGSAGKEIGYLSPGSCIDYAYDELGIKYSYAFEIFYQDTDLKEVILENREKISFLQVQQSPRERKQKLREQFKKQKSMGHSCFLQTFAQQNLSDESCFQYFNPETKQDYDWYINNWSDAIQDMLNSIVDEETVKSSVNTNSFLQHYE